MANLKWSNLKINKCPQCDKDLIPGLQIITIEKKGKLLTHKCGFRIYEPRYKQIVASQITADLERQLEEENNLI